jgi:hypothetical protein
MAFPAENQNSLRVLLYVAAGVILIRGTGMLALNQKLDADVDQYRQLAENLRQHHVYGRQGQGEIHPTAFRPPLYPLLLAGTSPDGTVGRWQVMILHLLMAIASAWIMILLARASGLGQASWLAGLLVTVDPILFYQSTQLMTETLATLLALLLLFALLRSGEGREPRWMLAAGTIAGLAILCRPTFLAFAGLAWLLLAVRRRWKPMMLFSAAAAVVLVPWIVRNSLVLGKPVLTTTHGGYTLLLGNNPHFYEHLRTAPWGSTWKPDRFDSDVKGIRWGMGGWHVPGATGHQDEEVPAPGRPWDFDSKTPHSYHRLYAEVHEWGEVEDDQFAYQLAFHSIRAEPASFAWSCLVRLGRLWSPFPHQVDSHESIAAFLLRRGTAVWYLVILSAAIAGCWRRRSAWKTDPWIWGLLLCLSFSLVHTFYWSNIRMRAPLMPFVYLAALGCLASRGSSPARSAEPAVESAADEL